jgi:hypothetical protein
VCTARRGGDHPARRERVVEPVDAHCFEGEARPAAGEPEVQDGAQTRRVEGGCQGRARGLVLDGQHHGAHHRGLTGAVTVERLGQFP